MPVQGYKTSKGFYLNQYTYGVALLELPFFLVAHLYENLAGLPGNGYSRTYNILIKTGHLVYAFLGLLLIYKSTKKLFEAKYAHIAIILIFLGTNLFWFSIFQAGMAHVPLFFLYALLIHKTIRIHETQYRLSFLAVGFICGLITLIRPTDIMCLFIPLLYNVYNKQTALEKWDLLKRNVRYILWACPMFILPLIPQMIYWKIMTGDYVFYSYNKQSFNWLEPKIIEGLLSFNNGWLAYSPIMATAILGMLLVKRIKPWVLCTWVIVPLYIYIIYSWYCYNYINGFGSRPMIHLYPLLAIPLTGFLVYIGKQHILLKSGVAVLLLFFISVNISNSMQQANGVLFSEDSNAAFHWQTLYKMNLSYDDLVVQDLGEPQPDQNKIDKVLTLKCENYEDSISTQFIKDIGSADNHIYHMRSEEFQPRPIKIRYDSKLFGGSKWLKCSGKFMCTEAPGRNKHLLVLDVKHKENFIKWKACKIENKIGVGDSTCVHPELTLYHLELNRWGRIYFFTKVPKDIQDGDEITLDIWNTTGKELYIDDLCLELYKEK